MSHTHYSGDFLELKEVTITCIENTFSEKRIGIELNRKNQICPYCGEVTNKVHNYRIQRVKDIAIMGRFTVLLLRKRRYVCTGCGKRFPEPNEFLARYQRMTGRMRQYIISRFSQMRSAASIAAESNCSVTTAIRFFGSVQYPRPNLPPILSIDEFKGNAGRHKFHSKNFGYY